MFRMTSFNSTQVYYGTAMFDETVTGGEAILYGFHDIVHINGNYMGFVESAGGKYLHRLE